MRSPHSAMNHQLHPLRVNPETGVPFLPLRKHSNIVVTPPRPSDNERLAELLSDPRIYEQLASPPVPYLLEHADRHLAKVIPKSKAVLQALNDAKDQERLITVEGCPVSSIREVQEDGSEVLIGDISIDTVQSRSRRFRVDENGRYVEERNDAEGRIDSKEESGAVIEWAIGDWLAPSHHNQGIMTDAVETMIHDWAIPRMKAQKIVCGAFTGNPASVRVFEKNGFKTKSIIEDAVEVRGRKRGIHIMEWLLTPPGVEVV